MHVSVSGCGPNQYASSWSVCESVSMCVGHIACEGVCAFSLWFFFLLNFFVFWGVFLFFFEFFCFFCCFLNFLGGFFCYFFVTVGMCTQKNTKRDQKKHKSNIKWMGIVHVSVSGCGPNQYASSWLVGWLVGQSVGRSVSWSSIVKLVDLVSHQVSWLVGRSVGRSVSWSSIIKLVDLVSHQVSWLVGRSVSQLVIYSVRTVGRMSSRKCLLAIPGEGWGPHSMSRPAQMRKPLRLFNFFIT